MKNDDLLAICFFVWCGCITYLAAKSFKQRTLEKKFEIAKEALKQIEHGNGLMKDASRSEKIAYKALNELSGKTGELK